MPRPTEKRKALIVVRTYPTPAKTGVEVSCTAAITADNQWMRLFPIPYRFLDDDQRFRKYQWVEVTVTKSNDTRLESFKLVPNSIKILSEPLSTAHEWSERKKILYPLRARSLCGLKKQQRATGAPTLGIFRPKSIKRLVIKPGRATWTQSQLQTLRQKHLFEKGPQKELEKIPFDFSYEFECEDSDCPGHKIICTDWEMGESWRKWRDKYGDAGWEAKFRERYEKEMIEANDTHFYVGTMHQHPHVWIIVGLFYPRKPAKATLFD